MCGLTGFWHFDRIVSRTTSEAILTDMATTIDHRGPDARGVWVDETAGLGLAHTRLSIRDLSPHGAQPMHSASGRYVIVYNGEVYNTETIKPSLHRKGYGFVGGSDTEVILAACEAFGVDQAVKQFVGMFAFALWDRQEKRLTLVRDRVGIKPLYFGIVNGVLFFGSQLKSFRQHPSWRGEIDSAVLTSYFYLNYVPAPHSIFKGIHKLKPGTFVTINADKSVQETSYWDFASVAQEGVYNRQKLSTHEAIDQLDTLLQEAVKSRMIADVPLGAFLSGGIDSSVVVSMMQSQSTQPVQTFSIGFSEEGYNEAVYAKKVAQHLGTQHQELYLTSQEAIDVIPKLPTWYDEPFADVSQIPTYLVSQLARKQVAVSLSGDGGDELFAGYHRYHLGYHLWRWVGYLPFPARRALSFLLKRFPISAYEWLAACSRGMLPARFGDKCQKLASILAMKTPQAFYETLISFWPKPTALVTGGNASAVLGWQTNASYSGNLLKQSLGNSRTQFIEQMQLMDSMTYLPDDILTKVDRASMAVGLEARVPLLDHRVIEWAWRLSPDLKVRYGQGKWILRQVLSRYVPTELFDRPKMGFGVPIDKWLRGPLRPWAEELLSLSALASSGYLQSGPIIRRWKEHLSGQRNWQYSLWGVLMFQQWYRHYITEG
ncbi:MAG: Asparagine synthetase [Pseudomonadota bacterium]|jgi:asparagine synthase (glutamine-hydrolysing)